MKQCFLLLRFQYKHSGNRYQAIIFPKLKTAWGRGYGLMSHEYLSFVVSYGFNFVFRNSMVQPVSNIE
eukprot:Em0021g1003a